MCFTGNLRCQLSEENQLDITACFIALMIRSTYFGHFYVHHQELETIFVLLPPMVCRAWLLVVGGQVQSSSLSVQEEGCYTTHVFVNVVPTGLARLFVILLINILHA